MTRTSATPSSLVLAVLGIATLALAGSAGAADPGMYQFTDPGSYLKDFSIIKAGGDFHIFYIRGRAGSTESWEELGNEVDFGHATSRNLRDWNIAAPVMKTRPGTWESRNVWAPHVVEHDGRFYMYYTGVNQNVAQQIGLATAEADLLLWWRHPDNPVLTPPVWSGWSEDEWSDGRDPCVLLGDDKHYLYYSTAGPNPAGATKEGVIAVAESTDLVHWETVGPAVLTDYIPESPCVFQHGEHYYLITSAQGRGVWRSDNPVEGWKPFDLELPEQLTGFEVFRDGEAWFIAGFEPKKGGNSVWISPLRWRDGKPTVVLPQESN